MRAAQSKGIADLAAFWPTQSLGIFPAAPLPPPPWLVQCKTGKARMSPADKKELVELAIKTGSVPILAEPGKNGRGVVFTDLTTEKEIAL